MTVLDDMLAQQQQDLQNQRLALNTPPANRPFQKPQGSPSPVATATAPGAGQGLGGLISGAAKAIMGAASYTASNPGTVAASAGAALLRAPGQPLGGTIDSLADEGKFIDDNIKAPYVRGALTSIPGIGQAVEATSAAQAFKRLHQQAQPEMPASLAASMSARSTLGQVGNPQVNEGLTQMAAIGGALAVPGAEGAPAAGPGMRVLQGAAKLLTNSVKVGAVTAAVVDPRAQRISDALTQAGVHGAVIDFLASHPGDSDAEARLKTGIEGAIGNAALEPLFTGVAKALKAASSGDTVAAQDAVAQLHKGVSTHTAEATPEDALRDNIDRAFASGRTQEARYAQAEALQATDKAETAGKPPEPLPETEKPSQDGTRHADLTPSDPKAQAATDANALLAKAGVKGEDLVPDTMEVTPNGKVVVSDAAKAAADEAGVGRAFHASSEEVPEDPVLFKEEDSNGGQRVVGGFPSKADLEGFVNDAKAHMESTDDLSITRGGQPELAPRTGEWNLGALGTSRDIPAFGRALAERLEATSRPRSDEELHTLAQSVANDTGLHPDDVLPLAAEFAGNTRDLDVGMQAVRTLQARILRKLLSLRELDFENLAEDDPAIDDAHLAVHNALTFSKAVADAKGDIGAAQRVSSLPDSDAYMEAIRNGRKPGAPSPDPIAGEVPLPRNKQELKTWLDQLSAMSTNGQTDAIQAFLRGKLTVPGKWAYLGSSFPNFFTGALVSAPRTLIRDLWGPAIISGVNTIGRTSAGAMQAINPFLDEAARREAWVASWGSARAYTATLSDTLDALRTAAKTTAGGFRKGTAVADPYWDPFGSNLGHTHSSLGGANPIDMISQGVPKILVDAAMGARGAGVTGAVPYYLGNLINKFPQAVMALHGGFNDFAQSLAYLGEVRATAYNEAAKLGLEGDDFRRYLNTALTNARDNATGAANDPAAFAQANRTTLTRVPSAEANDPAGMVALFKMRQSLVTAFPPARFILPIFNVPANALGESLRRIPGLGFLMKESGEQLAGQQGVAAMVDAYGRMLTGAGALMAGGMLAHNGMLTGAGPSSAVDRQVWEGKSADGMVLHQPYSIRVGDKWYSYQKSDVVGPLLSIMAGFYDKTVYHTDDLGNHAMAAVAGLAEYFKDQASLQGLSQVLDFGGDPRESATIMTRIIGQATSGFVPGFIKQVRDNVDPIQREHHTIGEMLMDAIPGLSQAVPPVRNVLGEPVMKPHSPIFGTLPISTANISNFQKDPIQDELYRLYDKTGEAHGVLPPGLGPNTGVDMRDVKLEDGTTMYDAIMRYRGLVSRDENGQTLREALASLHTSGDYVEAPNGSSSDDDGSKGRMNAKTFQEFTKQAEEDVANASPIAARYLATSKAMQANTNALNGHTANDLIRNPDLFKALGIDIGSFEDTVKGN